MPSYDKNKRTRMPSIAARMRSIMGLSFEEKGALVRIGNLIDAYVKDRDLNTLDGEARQYSTRVPAPSNVVGRAITSGIEVTWDPVDFIGLAIYEVQYSETSTFGRSITVPTHQNRAILTNLPATTLWVRVRTVSKDSKVSPWVTVTGSITFGVSPFEIDTDYIDPEIRTHMADNSLHPQLIGSPLAVGVSSRIFFGVGAAIGPGPTSFIDSSGGSGFYSSTNKHQITYSVQQNDVEKQYGTLGMPIDWSDSFYDIGPREYMVGTGSFVNFFYVDTFFEDPTIIDIKFLDYQQIEHEQTGTVNNATMAIIKH
jgi:hypothetical protein